MNEKKSGDRRESQRSVSVNGKSHFRDIGWTFTDAEIPVFALSNLAHRVYRALEDWRGRPIRSDVWPSDGNLTLKPLPPGYYRVKCSDLARLAPESFTFCVVTTNRCRNMSSPFAADAALSGCSRRGSYAWTGNRGPTACQPGIDPNNRARVLRKFRSVHVLRQHIGTCRRTVDGGEAYSVVHDRHASLAAERDAAKNLAAR